MNLMLIVVPRYGALLMTTCGFLMLGTICGYFGMLPETPLVIHIEGTMLNFQFGWCFWLVLIAGYPNRFTSNCSCFNFKPLDRKHLLNCGSYYNYYRNS